MNPSMNPHEKLKLISQMISDLEDRERIAKTQKMRLFAQQRIEELTYEFLTLYQNTYGEQF